MRHLGLLKSSRFAMNVRLMESSSRIVNTSFEAKFSDKIRIICLILVAACSALPFLNKAIHIDDPLFVWTAKQIQTDPANFYGFDANWYGAVMPMSQITKNPPIASYYLAAAASLGGWSELVLHTAFFLVTVGTALGMYALAKKFCTRPLEAALGAMLTPVFLVSSTTLMCDMMMLAFWVWATVFWIEGIQNPSRLKLVVSAILVALCLLTKYFGINLVVLLAVYAIVEQRRISFSLVALSVPILALCGYQWLTASLYGRGLLLDAASYATNFRALAGQSFSSAMFAGATFAGGCFITILFYSFRLWSKREIFAGIIFALLLLLIIFPFKKLGHFTFPENAGVKLSIVAQSALMVVAGMSLIALIVTDYVHYRNAASLLLVLWALGTMLFATLINWGINARSFLPMAPALGILLMRRLERFPDNRGSPAWRTMRPLLPAAGIALLVTLADASLANTVKAAATDIAEKYNRQTIWFQGHWGFQYYMESFGAKPVDYDKTQYAAGDIIVIPSNNTSIQSIPKNIGTLIDVVERRPLSWLTSMNIHVGAGFYADVWGPLPYVFGPVPNETFLIVRAEPREE